ncbi:MAG: hypothetical protein Q7T46_03245 [Polaromonas sp.]|nr:hypothetical protein [Polaromonas sp.]
MKSRYNQFNPKRRFLQPSAEELTRLCDLAKTVAYGGNPEHKKNPGDFGLHRRQTQDVVNHFATSQRYSVGLLLTTCFKKVCAEVWSATDMTAGGQRTYGLSQKRACLWKHSWKTQ